MYTNSTTNDEEFTKFKIAFKYYKRKEPPPSMENVIDLDKAHKHMDSVQEFELRKECTQFSDDIFAKYGLNSCKDWKAFTFNNSQGLFFIRDVFTEKGKNLWSLRSVKDFSKAPQKTNLLVNHSQEDVNTAYEVSENIVKSNAVTGWFNQKKQLKLLKTCPIWPLRWATLGYHYNWTQREYESEIKSDFPSDVAEVTKIIAAALGFDDYTPEAGITNFYHVGANISPHVDISEPHKQAPLVSMSFGLPAIFLMGEDDLNVEPEAFFIRSGDVIVMSGRSRLGYHSVPAVLPQPNELKNTCDFLPLYLAHTRININVRQVESDDFKLPLPNNITST